MPKLDPLALLDYAPERQTREFTDPLQPGQVLTLTMKRMEHPDRTLGQAVARVLVETYVAPPDGKGPPPWPPPPHRPIRMSEAFCETLAWLEVLQCPDDPQEAYDAAELAILSVRMPTAWVEIAAWVNSFNVPAAEAPAGNASAAREASSSAPPAISDAPTPASTTISPTSSGASTNALPDGRDYRHLVSTPVS